MLVEETPRSLGKEYNDYIENEYEIFIKEKGYERNDPEAFDIFFEDVSEYSTWLIEYQRDKKIDEILK